MNPQICLYLTLLLPESISGVRGGDLAASDSSEYFGVNKVYCQEMFSASGTHSPSATTCRNCDSVVDIDGFHPYILLKLARTIACPDGRFDCLDDDVNIGDIPLFVSPHKFR
ncbi:uncharacterized protein EDB91DRAFT_1166518 [Suillus paluster]|uniref:uncharacterized protein n=1 Tax=Suillus paluster TaxID=48578 RepID=UPI001B86A3EC|nr:uncharacterized protein EDB91DRAFT_1166518 [Suillus paluster]KAG1726271.1 hypothetical protein EDB91DRAFT_1166518 [Suillus paluster]